LTFSQNQFVYRPLDGRLADDSAGLVNGTVPSPGGETALCNASGLSFLRHIDWLGSARLGSTWAHVTDAHLLALALSHDAKLVSLDSRIPGAFLIPELPTSRQ
jgi:hypothetical protein